MKSKPSPALPGHMSAGFGSHPKPRTFRAYISLFLGPLATAGRNRCIAGETGVHERTTPSREQVRTLRAAVADRPGSPARPLVDLLYG